MRLVGAALWSWSVLVWSVCGGGEAAAEEAGVMGQLVFAESAAGGGGTEAPAEDIDGELDAHFEQIGRNVSSVLQLIVSQQQAYDKRIRPNYRRQPVKVGVSIHVQDVSAISEVNMDFTLDFYFRQKWQDSRLKFDKRLQELSIGAEMAEKIWKPDTFFVNAKKAFFHEATMKNTFIRIRPNGEVFISIRLTVTASCPMDLTYFPMDSQKCTLEVESFGYTDKDISYYWIDYPKKSVVISDEVQLPQFKVIQSRECNKTIGLSTGNYSRLSVEIFFRRSMGYYLIQIYVPSMLIVVISWVSFWIARDAAPARVALGITTVLTMTTLISSTNAALPKISYLKSIDIYLVTCFIMVFATLLEYAVVSYVSKRWQQYMNKKKHQQDGKVRPAVTSPVFGVAPFTPELSTSGGGLTESAIYRRRAARDGREGGEEEDPLALAETPTEIRLTSMKTVRAEVELAPNPSLVYTNAAPCQCATQTDHPDCCACHSCLRFRPGAVDKYSRFVFPIVFVIFNILYWIMYVNISSRQNIHSPPGSAIATCI